MTENSKTSGRGPKENKPVESTRLVTFWHGITSNSATPFESRAFRVTRFTEREIASWHDLKRVIASQKTYEDGGVSHRKFILGPEWDVRERLENPSSLAELYALDFGYSRTPFRPLRGGELRMQDMRTELAQLLLRLSRHGEIWPLNEMFFTEEEPGKSRTGSILKGSFPIPSQDWCAWVLDEPAKLTLARLVKGLWEKLLGTCGSWPDDCMVAAHHFAKAGTSKRVEQEIDLWIALEAMFSPDDKTELRYRIASYCAAFTRKESRFETYTLLRDRYVTRSKLVHGSDKPSKLRGDRLFSEMYSEYVGLEEIVRVALRRYLRCRIVNQMSREAIHKSLERESISPGSAVELPLDPAFDPTLEA